ncbi:hypothetical protein F4779DRAFT_617701 [Xylariaceae sp. FL0662B]|nr:hypothetical protein F4779DRAFT_617701 [Xylariaceae sp. FL0662B]
MARKERYWQSSMHTGYQNQSQSLSLANVIQDRISAKLSQKGQSRSRRRNAAGRYSEDKTLKAANKQDRAICPTPTTTRSIQQSNQRSSADRSELGSAALSFAPDEIGQTDMSNPFEHLSAHHLLSIEYEMAVTEALYAQRLQNLNPALERAAQEDLKNGQLFKSQAPQHSQGMRCVDQTDGAEALTGGPSSALGWTWGYAVIGTVLDTHEPSPPSAKSSETETSTGSSGTETTTTTSSSDASSSTSSASHTKDTLSESDTDDIGAKAGVGVSRSSSEQPSERSSSSPLYAWGKNVTSIAKRSTFQGTLRGIYTAPETVEEAPAKDDKPDAKVSQADNDDEDLYDTTDLDDDAIFHLDLNDDDDVILTGSTIAELFYSFANCKNWLHDNEMFDAANSVDKEWTSVSVPIHTLLDKYSGRVEAVVKFMESFVVPPSPQRTTA